jgi:lysophospholipase L1-like esterase
MARTRDGTPRRRGRNDVNQWIRTKASFDDVIDFDKVVRDASNPDLIYAPFNCGDGIHPSPSGYYAMGTSVDLNLFRRK